MLAFYLSLLRLVPWMMAIKWQALRRGCRPPGGGVRADREALWGARESYRRVAENSSLTTLATLLVSFSR